MRFTTVAVALGMIFVWHNAEAQQPFYAGKTITITIGFGPGGA